MGYWKFLDTASAEKDFEDDYNVIVQNAFGVGMPPHNNIITPFSLADGGSYQRTIIPPRVFTLQCATKTTTVDAWHTAREDLFDQLKRDRAGTISPVTIRYDDGTTTLDIAAYYDGGLEIGTLEKTIEKFAIRFICADPFWKASSTSNTSLNVRATISNEGVVYRDSAGLWNSDAPAPTADAFARFAQKPNGDVIVGGLNNNIYIYNGSTFTDIGTINTGAVQDVAADAGNNVIVVGTFTDIDGTTARRIAYYNGSAWSEPATNGFDSHIFAVEVDHSGNYIVGGVFTTDALGGGTYRRIAEVNASTGAITELDAGLNNEVDDIVIDKDGNAWIGGSFTLDGPASVDTDRLAKYDGTDIIEVDTGVNGQVFNLAYSRITDTVYAAGAFTTTEGGKTLTYMAKAVGGLLFDLDIDSAMALKDTMALDPVDDTLYYMLTTTDRLYSLRGGVEVSEDIRNDTANFNGMFVDSNQIVWLSQVNATANTWVTAGRTTVNNTGTAEAYPTIVITGPGAVHILRNYTSGKSIYFNDLTLLSSETLTIDLSVGVKTVKSSLRGNLINKVAAPSDLATWSLLPGNNNVSLWVDDATATATITWTATFWSIDGVT